MLDRTERTDKPTTAIFVLRLQATRDDASVRALRWILKIAKRQFGMRCLSVVEEVVERTETAARDGLIARIGQDETQKIMSAAFAPYRGARCV